MRATFPFFSRRLPYRSKAGEASSRSLSGREKKYESRRDTDPPSMSSALRSERAIRANIEIIRTFTRLREMLATHADLRRKIEAMERKYDKRFRVVFEALRALLHSGQEPKREVGFK